MSPLLFHFSFILLNKKDLMRHCLLLLSLTLVGLTGCAPHYKPVKPFSNRTQGKAKKPVTSQQPVQIYNDATYLENKAFRDLGKFSAEGCQRHKSNALVSMSTARKRMEAKALNLKANAILVQKCNVISIKGCYRQAICHGSALEIAQ